MTITIVEIKKVVGISKQQELLSALRLVLGKFLRISGGQ